MTKLSSVFIVIDDDPVNNLLCNIVINDVSAESKVKTFDIPEQGFDYIANEHLDCPQPAVLFLDINMPTLSGWEFLAQFDKLDERVKARFNIYMLSSSIDDHDKQRAFKNQNVIGYLEKPLTEETVLSILRKFEKSD